ncbi:Lrp/AsnC family transcriptional regulator [Azospirillum sp. YIM DDC1]|uniref:Lrp/AsnC family transcriptional regulator n=2 Tax=Azospirillum TaxID=191 RepID=A0A4D8PLD6_9PROT|nr:Lrp/AsnC family transcriptional regulator [Azospirillum aestuarii]MBK3774340.1 AsnC family transcriptional regulator [Azospirillum brasilense]MBK4721118.1 Lrp/AsnC family transcriptional regulator [Azospirillum aestuarii]QCN99313.1 Lrp/AsnC family transcriptional regulator [Azospirillum argentinense]
MTIDATDRKILAALQADATLSLADLGKQVGLSATPCWRRVQRLEQEGYVRRRVALLDRAKLNVDVTVFVAVRTSKHSAEWLEEFRRVVADIPEVVDLYRLSGEIDYLLRVVIPDIKAYDAFYRKLIERIELQDVSSMFAMEEMKSTTEVPLSYVKTQTN